MKKFILLFLVCVMSILCFIPITVLASDNIEDYV